MEKEKTFNITGTNKTYVGDRNEALKMWQRSKTGATFKDYCNANFQTVEEASNCGEDEQPNAPEVDKESQKEINDLIINQPKADEPEADEPPIVNHENDEPQTTGTYKKGSRK